MLRDRRMTAKHLPEFVQRFNNQTAQPTACLVNHCGQSLCVHAVPTLANSAAQHLFPMIVMALFYNTCLNLISLNPTSVLHRSHLIGVSGNTQSIRQDEMQFLFHVLCLTRRHTVHVIKETRKESVTSSRFSPVGILISLKLTRKHLALMAPEEQMSSVPRRSTAQ